MKPMDLQVCQKATVRALGVLLVVLLAWSSVAQNGGTWTRIQIPFTVGGTPLLLTDGTVLLQQAKSSNYWLLTPQKYTTKYSTGTFAPTGSLPVGYAPIFYASAVLPDGRAIVEGGEYNNGSKDWTNLGAIYDPIVTHSWMAVTPPSGWTKIGDAQSAVLPDGQFMLASCCVKQAALLNASTLTWTVLTSTTGYKGKFDSNDEEGWTLLPNGNLLTVDAYVGVNDATGDLNPMNSETYDPATGTWTTAGSTVVQLWDSHDGCGDSGGTHEIGPAVLMTTGKVFVGGSNTCPSTAGHTSLYDTTTSPPSWTPGPDIPGVNDMADAPAALMPNGQILLDTNPGWGKSPSTFYVFDGTNINAIPQPPFFPATANTEGGRMLNLPSGSILLVQGAQPNLWFYKPAGTYQAAWQPHICAACYPAIAFIGGTYTVSGTQFNGFSQASAYGDDSQNATNYPVAVITNDTTGHKFFARTHNFSTMAVATGGLSVSAEFDVLPGTETGNSTLQLITNGIPSNTVGIIISQ